MFVTNWISTTKIQKISEITNFFRHYFLSRTEVIIDNGYLKPFLADGRKVIGLAVELDDMGKGLIDWKEVK